MLSNRQLKILDYYLNSTGIFIPSKEIADFFNISVRTVKNELSKIRKICQKYESFELISLPGKGTNLSIKDKCNFEEDIAKLKFQEEKTKEGFSNNCVNEIIKYLLDSRKPVTKYEVMSHFYISETTLYNRVNEIKSILNQFNLSLKYTTNVGYKIVGKELDKRTCIAKIGLDYETVTKDPESMTLIYNVVADTFIKYKYHINEAILQNITAHIFRSLQRIRQYHFIEENMDKSLFSTKEFKIADKILSSFINKNTINEKNYMNEVCLLTQIILGKLNNVGDDVIKEKINSFIDVAFESIRQKFSVNFNSVENLRLLLVLHLVPLFYRIKSGTQLTNPMKMEIHNSFPQAYDIALYFALLIENHFNLKVSTNEISYLALYFNYGFETYLASSKGKKIMIVTSLRKSETTLLRHKILNRFPKQIESIDFINQLMLDKIKDINDYDAFFTTEKNLDQFNNLIPFIHLFPTESDLKKIGLSINGYTEIDDVLNKFDPQCFFSGKVVSKKQILSIVSKNAIQTYDLTEDLLTSINEREKLSSTYFGNGIAIPHPLTPISDETFVSLALLSGNGINWDKKNNVSLVMLVSIGKDNPKELQFWYYISSFVAEKRFIDRVLENPTFDNFIDTLRLSLRDNFN